jgi:23S rRNA (pseudouridine1915-N3)-methyltransferase
VSVRIITIGDQMPSWVAEGFKDYAGRLPPHLCPSLVSIPRPKGAHKAKDKQAQCRREGEAILSRLSDDEWVIALTPTGKSLDTTGWARAIETWAQERRKIAFLIGGSDGLDAACLARAQSQWTLSALTFPHMLVRVILAEQLYRAWSLTQGHPYHK